MEAHHQFVAAAVLVPVIFDRFGQRLDVGLVVVIVLDQAQLGDVAHLPVVVEHRIPDRGRGRARVLRIGRQHQDAFAAARLEVLQHVRQGRRPVAHRHRHLDVLVAARVQLGLQRRRLLCRVDLERRPLARPDHAVLLG